jgi:YebC/PmpR family DNA-binding regulatory protein
MSGHSHWSEIKHQKAIIDKKRARIFSKLLIAISSAAKNEPNPDFNPRLRSAVEKAREFNVPSDNIARAIKRASEVGKELNELLFEAYGPGGAALLISALSDNSNRTVQEIKTELNENGGKWAEPGSVRWAFEKVGEDWSPKFSAAISSDEKIKMENLVSALMENNAVQDVFINAQ